MHKEINYKFIVIKFHSLELVLINLKLQWNWLISNSDRLSWATSRSIPEASFYRKQGLFLRSKNILFAIIVVIKNIAATYNVISK